MSKNRFHLDESVRQKYVPIIREHIYKIATCNLEDASRYDICLELSDTELNPYTLGMILVGDFGYEEEDTDTNGWEMDFWTNYRKENMPALCVQGCGITFDLTLRGDDDDTQEYNSDELLKNNKEFQELIQKGIELIKETERMLQD